MRGETVLCPSNTFMATPLAAIKAGAEVEFVDCNREDLCMSFEDFERKAERHKPRAAILVHIGGHIAFDSERIAAYCARATGSSCSRTAPTPTAPSWNGRRPGGFGDAGVYSLYATKTVSTGEGGVLVSADPDLIEFARKFRNYGKFEHEVDGLNFRMSEFTAALALVQAERMEEIVAWKNEYAREHLDPLHPAPARAARGDDLRASTSTSSSKRSRSRPGRVYEEPCHRIMGRGGRSPQHRVGGREPLVRAALLPTLRAGDRMALSAKAGEAVRVLVTGGGGFIGSHVVDRLIATAASPRGSSTSAPRPTTRRSEVETFTGSITDPANLDLAMRDCDAVIHLAAVADVGHVHADPVLAEEVNTRGTLNVLEAACRAEVGRVVYGSTTWVYSDCAEQEVDEETPIPAPRHLYTATKLAGETYCAGYAELFDLESTVLRFGIPYGPRARAAGVVAKFTDLAFEGKALTIAGDGSRPAASSTSRTSPTGSSPRCARRPRGRTYNLSGDEVVTILEIAERVQENTDDCEIVHTPPRPGDFPGKVISNERALRGDRLEGRDQLPRGRAPLRRVGPQQHPPARPGARQAALAQRQRARAPARCSPGPRRSGERPPRVLVLTADIGEGHDLPARMIKADVEASIPGAEVEIVNGLEAMGRISSSVARDGSRFTFRWMPWLFDAPVLADHEVRADPLAHAPPQLLARRPRACCG